MDIWREVKIAGFLRPSFHVINLLAILGIGIDKFPAILSEDVRRLVEGIHIGLDWPSFRKDYQVLIRVKQAFGVP